MTDLTTKPNAELAYRVLDHIDARPELWRQGVWVAEAECGTVGCFAGWAVLLSGCKVSDAVDPDPVVVNGPKGLLGLGVMEAADVLLRIDAPHLDERNLTDPYDGLHTRESLGDAVLGIFGPRPTGGAQ